MQSVENQPTFQWNMLPPFFKVQQVTGKKQSASNALDLFY
jgi:hypothetical protein